MSRRQEGPEQEGPAQSRISISGGHSLRSISGPAITGTITSLDVPQVEAGEYIDIAIVYNAYNPGGSWTNWWKVFLVAKDSLGNQEMVKDVDVKASSFNDSGSWRLWKMPSQAIRLEIRLYGHDEIVPWDWSWWPESVS